MFNATPLLRLYARRRIQQLATLDPARTQEKTLLKLLRAARTTRFGQDHKFDSIKSVSDFQQRVRLRRYEDFWNEYFKDVFPVLDNCTWPGRMPFYSVSSGTSSGPTKYLGYNNEMNRSNTKAGLDLLSFHLANSPRSKIFAGKSFVLGGSTDLSDLGQGIFCGDLSGLAVKTLPWWARMRYFPPPELALIKDWEKKVDTLARRSLQEDIRMISGVPSWMLIFVEKLKELRPESNGRLASIYPNLDLVVHGGVNFSPYRKQFQELLQGSSVDLREVYPASEGFIAVADRDYNEGLRLMLDNDIFFEFVPLEELHSSNPTRHWVHNIEIGVNYAVVMTTCAGLWSYVIGDTVKFVDRTPARLLISGRVSYFLSAFGEHLLGDEIEDALSYASESIQATVSDYSVGALYPQTSAELGGHLYVVEFSKFDYSEQSRAKFLQVVDDRLRKGNEDYDAHRSNGFGLNPPRLMVVKPGTFAAWMKSRGKLGGQNKVPRVVSNPELFLNLQSFARERQA
jgi:hypothetical protein